MTATTSTIPLAKDTILTLLRARPDLSGVQISWGHPGKDVQRESMFFYSDPESTEQDQAIGNNRRREDYTLPLTVCVYMPGNDAQAAEERMWEIVAEVEQCLRDNPRLGIDDPIISATVTGYEPHNYFDQGTRISECDVRITIAATKPS